MGKTIQIDTYFKRKSDKISEVESSLPTYNVDTPIVPISNVDIPIMPTVVVDPPISEDLPTKTQRVEIVEIDLSSLERDPGLRKSIYDYHITQCDEIRRAYIKAGPFQPLLSEYKKSGSEKHLRSFQWSWFDTFPSWLEYSPSKDAAFCLSCYLFSPPSGNQGNSAFLTDGFRNWKKARDGFNSGFLHHEGKDPNSFHKIAQNKCEDLLNQPQHIHRVVEKYSAVEIASNQLLVETSIRAARYLASHTIAFRGHDESAESLNHGNFLDLVAFQGECNEKIAGIVLKNDKQQNAIYTSPQIQKEILHIYATKVKKAIREENGDAKFSIIVDEARDESKREQMSIVLRFVDKEGILLERFFGLVHVSDTVASTLEKEICSVLSNHCLDVRDIRGQGYDGASNMRGEWNGLQALIMRDCPHAYYIHCLAHRLQLALVTASKEVFSIFDFFGKLTTIINAVGGSCKHNDELKAAKASEIEYYISIDELETGSGKNQIGTVRRPCDTHWSSHLKSISSLIDMFSPTCEVLLNLKEDGSTFQDRGAANAAYMILISFGFVFILHLMQEIMKITNVLCQDLQRKSQDLVNAIHLVSSTKSLLQKLRDGGWDPLIAKVISFCVARTIDIPDMSVHHIPRQGRARGLQDEFTIEHYYRVETFYVAIDSQLQEFTSRFNERSMELTTFASTLDPREHESFRMDDVCQLVEKFYPQDFTDLEKEQLKMQLPHCEHNVVRTPEFQALPTMSELCKWLVKTRRSTIYHLVYRVITLVLTLSVSTASAERSFSTMKIIKNRLRNKMEDEYLSNSAVIYIEKEIALKFSLESIIDDFRDLEIRKLAL